MAYSPLFYELDYQGQRFASGPVAVGRRDARYWRIATAEPLARERVALRLEYPHGAAAGVGRGHGAVSARGGHARAGGRPRCDVRGRVARVAGGEARRRARYSARGASSAGQPRSQVPYEFPWRVTLLWAVLGGGALAVAWMAVRLARELNHPQA